jgi:radical SAM protein with 4Fe4S-binding SPASM domain
MMQESFATVQSLPKSVLWEKYQAERKCSSFSLEITARCNNDCGHCYINLPVNDPAAKRRELSLEQITGIAAQAAELGALWCLISGGEPLLRPDFEAIYLAIKRKGFLVSVFTNATLVTGRHMSLFRQYPPRDIEVTVYGVTEAVYERVSGVRGSFKAFMRGLDLLLSGGIPVRFKAMALQSNLEEMPQIAAFCRARTKDYFRFDPQLHLRFDGDAARNARIKAERLTPEQFVALEQSDPERFGTLQRSCNALIFPAAEAEAAHGHCRHLFHCGTGQGAFNVSYDGYFRLCSSLWEPSTLYDLKTGTLKDAWENFVPQVRDQRSDNPDFLAKCRLCPIVNLCIWCPAHAHLETGAMDAHVDYFCRLAHARAAAIQAPLPS